MKLDTTLELFMTATILPVLNVILSLLVLAVVIAILVPHRLVVVITSLSWPHRVPSLRLSTSSHLERSSRYVVKCWC